MGRILGHQAKLYRNSGTHAEPVWVEIDNCKDLSRGLEKGEADVTTRANNGWEALTGGLKQLSLEFDMVYDTSDDNVNALEDAFWDDDPIEFLVLDGPADTAGSKGVRATMEVFQFGQEEELREAVTIGVVLKPTYAENPPVRYTVPTPP